MPLLQAKLEPVTVGSFDPPTARRCVRDRPPPPPACPQPALLSCELQCAAPRLSPSPVHHHAPPCCGLNFSSCRFVSQQSELMQQGVERKEAFKQVEQEFSQQR